ncbi:MAG: hypothetical protein ABFR90_01240 [Planctomycetota bacterium]
MNIKHGLLLFVVFLYGCLPSLQPLYTSDTLVFDEAILGKWYGGGGNWSFTKKGEKGYNLRVVECEGEEAKFEVRLVQVGDHRFIDLYPGDNINLENTPDIYNGGLVPAHRFMKLDLSEPNLLLQWVNFEDVIRDDPDLLKHEKRGDYDPILITAASEDIQRALIENLDKVLDGDVIAMRKCSVDFSQIDIIFDQNLLGQWESDERDYLDIIALDDGYDIQVIGESEQLRYYGILYNLNDRPVLGLYCGLDHSAKWEAQKDFPPDVLVQVECDEHQLKIHGIEWDEVEAFMDDNSAYSFDNFEPDNVFLRVSE